MSVNPSRQDARKPRPWWLGLGVLAMGALWLNGARSIASTTNYIGVGPAAIILAVGIGLTILGVILITQAMRGELVAAAEGEDEAPPSRSAFLLALAGVSIPLLTIRWLGFPLTAMLAFTLVTHAFGSRRTGFDLLVGAALGSAAWFGFSRLGISLGPFLPLIG
ncbi:tripartite tricarboxylate transporter TctB family protein [Bosea sp. 2RAB26]|uniref:tripartite tricarboxylate transporter TctB family protein n=1 Tax=Bosea sp. 2RAB26 TaxID=3237476 RepID=UPI003F92AF39